MNKRVVIFIDQFLPKNKLQYNYFKDTGYMPTYFVNSMYAEKGEAEQLILAPTFSHRLKQVIAYFKKYQTEVHHVEIYPGGRFTFIYALLAKWYKIKIICAERGDLLYFKSTRKGGYPLFVRLSMFICYQLADIVWYREPYMEARLKQMGIRKTMFIHNTVKKNDQLSKPKDIDFLWVNRIIPERNANWFVEHLNLPEFKDTHNALLGILSNNKGYSILEKYLLDHKPNNLDIIAYSDPHEYYQRARFFVLPSSIIFANNALLEAMSYGVVPIISKAPSSELLVEDGISGFIFENHEEGFLEAMKKAMNLSPEEYLSFSNQTRRKIQSDFSEEYYYTSLTNSIKPSN